MRFMKGVASVLALLLFGSGSLVMAQDTPSAPAATPTPGAEGWTVIGSKGPTPRNTEIRTPSNLAIREARYRVHEGRLLLHVELHERPTGDSMLSVRWRLAGASLPTYSLDYYFANRRVVFGRRVVTDPTRGLGRTEPIAQPGIKVSLTGSFVDIELPLEALRPEDGTWEIEVITLYLGRDNLYWRVDWLGWTRLVLR
jgi:hypothetical protein